MPKTSNNTMGYFFNIIRIEFGVQQHIGQDFRGILKMVFRDFAPVKGQLFVGSAVQNTANSLNGLRNFARCGAGRCAAKTKVFPLRGKRRLPRVTVSGEKRAP